MTALRTARYPETISPGLATKSDANNRRVATDESTLEIMAQLRRRTME